MITDIDADMDRYFEQQSDEIYRRINAPHRCSSDVSPCPECQERNDNEDAE